VRVIKDPVAPGRGLKEGRKEGRKEGNLGGGRPEEGKKDERTLRGGRPVLQYP
jgi:hypothetical protein